MSFTQENGYLPVTIQTIMNAIMLGINIQFGTSYTAETFQGTNHYKFFYALAQRVQSGEIKTAEIFLKYQQYISIMNERISRPVNTNPGIIEKFANYVSTYAPSGYLASVKPMIEADAGKIHIAVNMNEGLRAKGSVTITNFANLTATTADTLAIGATVFTAQAGAATPGTATFQAASSLNATATSLATQINAHATAGALVKAVASGAIVYIYARHGGTAGNSIGLTYVSNGSVGLTTSGATLADGTSNPNFSAEKADIALLISQITVGGTVTMGTESTAIVISNGQSFDFKFNLPDRIPTKLKLTIKTSENNQVVIEDPDTIKAKLLVNINTRYQLGRNFEPQRYFSVVDAPWASEVKLEYSLDNGVTWLTAVYDANYDALLEFGLADIELVEI